MILNKNKTTHERAGETRDQESIDSSCSDSGPTQEHHSRVEMFRSQVWL